VIPGTSVTCERLLSVAKNILTDTRKNTSPFFRSNDVFKTQSKSLEPLFCGKSHGENNKKTQRREVIQAMRASMMVVSVVVVRRMTKFLPWMMTLATTI
jgi:hypothetical protein